MFIARSNFYINQQLRERDKDEQIKSKEQELRELFEVDGISIWDRLLPSTRTSLISAGVLLDSCQGIKTKNFDYSGICISATSALEGELRRWFFEGYQNYEIKHHGNPETLDVAMIQKKWPQQLLEIKDGKYRLKKPDRFTMGSLSYVFEESFTIPETGSKRWYYIFDYLKTIVKHEYRKNPCIALNDHHNSESFVKLCERVKDDYRNPAAHPGIIPQSDAERCYCQIVGKAKAENHMENVKGLIIMLYGYLKE
jgi:hypothetical protein